MAIYGWDASDFDWARGQMDLVAAVRDGIVFFTHKATEGTRTRHVRYGEALNRARAAGIPFLGAYVVPRTPGNNGHGSIPAQVDYFLSYLDAQTPWWRSTREFFIQVDTEKWGYDDVAPAHGAQMCALLRAQTGKWVIHYAPRWAYGNTIPGDEPLWASSYGSNPAVPYRQAYPGDSSTGWASYSGRTPTILQYGSKTRIGTQTTCDANAFRGTLAQFRALVTGGGDDMAQLDDVKQAVDEMRAIVRMLHWGWAPTYDEWVKADGEKLFPGVYGRVGGGAFITLFQQLVTDLAAVKASEAASLAAVKALADAVKAGGGNVETAGIVAAIDEAVDRVRVDVRAQLAAQAARQAKAARVEADALSPDAQ